MPYIPGLALQAPSRAVLELLLLSLPALTAHYRTAHIIEHHSLYVRLRRPGLIHNLHNTFIKGGLP